MNISIPRFNLFGLRIEMKVVALVLGLILGGLLLKPGHALAAVCGGGVAQGNTHSMAGLVVYSQYKDAQGNVHPSTNTGVFITTVNPPTKPVGAPVGNLAKMAPGDGSVASYQFSAIFNQISSPECQGQFALPDSHAVVLGYNGTSSPGDGADWAIDCAESVRGANNPQPFDITGNGVPTGQPSGGTWDTKRVSPPNGQIIEVVVTYSVSQPANAATLNFVVTGATASQVSATATRGVGSCGGNFTLDQSPCTSGPGKPVGVNDGSQPNLNISFKLPSGFTLNSITIGGTITSGSCSGGPPPTCNNVLVNPGNVGTITLNLSPGGPSIAHLTFIVNGYSGSSPVTATSTNHAAGDCSPNGGGSFVNPLPTTCAGKPIGTATGSGGFMDITFTVPSGSGSTLNSITFSSSHSGDTATCSAASSRCNSVYVAAPNDETITLNFGSNSGITISGSCSSGSETITVTDQGRGPLNINWNIPSTGQSGTSTNPTFTISMGTDPNPTTITVTAVDGPTSQTTSVTYTCTPPSGCPSLPNPDVDVSLPDQAPNVGPPSGDTTTAPQTVYQETPENKTKVTSIQDISNGGSRTPPTEVSEAYQTVKLDYTPYIQNYPYDKNQPSVTYDSYYDETPWTTSFDYYSCNSGDSLSGSTCTHDTSYDYSTSFICDTFNANGTCKTGHYVACNPGDSGGNGSCHHSSSSTYTATSNYKWVAGTTTTGKTKSNTVNGLEMEPCYARQFNLIPHTISSLWVNPSSSDPSESPATVTFGSNIETHFSTAHGGIGVRQSLKAITGINATYTLMRADGSSPTYDSISSTRCGGSYTSSPSNFTLDSSSTSLSFDGTLQANTDCYTATLPPLKIGDQACVTITTNPSQGDMDPDGNTSNISVASRTSTETTCTPFVVNKPYVRMYGNDIEAGGGFEGVTILARGYILGFLNTALALPVGSTDQLAAYATGTIDAFGSSQQVHQPVNPPLGLTFENTGTPGNLGNIALIPDYFKKIPVTPAPHPYVSGGSLDQGAYQSGSVTIGASGPVTLKPVGLDGKPARIALFVTGNVTILNNITFDTSKSWDVNKAPIIDIIVNNGSIFIDPNVTHLDGVYIAQPGGSSNSGSIYTCSQGGSFSASLIYNQCKQQLVVNGAFIAQAVKLQRNFGSMRDALQNEQPVSGGNNCSDGTTGWRPIDGPPSGVCAAEVFNFSPMIYMAQPPFLPPGGQRFDSVTSLAPVL